MTVAMNHPNDVPTEKDLIAGVVIGLKVYDVDGSLIGTVESVDERAGWMRVETNPFFEEPLVVPLNQVVAIDRRELVLSAHRHALAGPGVNGRAGKGQP